MNKNPLISFILPNYNNGHVLDLFFEKFIFHNTYDNYEFIIVDDGSEDHSLEVLYKWKNSGKIKDMLIIKEPHFGIINALNKALFLAKGEFVIRCDGDATIETSSFVEKFLEFYYINPEKIGVITSKVISDTGWLHALGRMVISDKGLLDNGKEPIEPIGKRKWDFLTSPIQHLSDVLDIPVEVDTALGVFTFFKKDIALKIGGFDKNFPLWIEDDDFFLSFRLFNQKCFYLPSIEVCHRFSLRGSRNPNSWKKKRYFNFIKTVDDEVQLIRSYYFKGVKFFKRKFISWRPKILLHDYDYWKQKWGFDCLNPDMEVVKRLYKDTEILWNYNIRLKNKGKQIIDEYIKKLNKCSASDVKILVGYHKKTPLIESSILTPIFLGKASWGDLSKDGKLKLEDFRWMCKTMLGDDTGKNISQLNRFFCEMTGIYWIWKNYEKVGNPRYIGFMQYRRHLKFGQNYFSPPSLFYKGINSNYLINMGLLDKVILDTIEDYDILCVKPLVLESSVFEQFRELENLPFDLDFKIFEELIDYIKEYCVDYRTAISEYMNGNKHYWYNCFVMKKELFDDFCNFAFPIMFHFHKKIDYSRMSIAGKRILGFISERLYGIFLTKQIQNQAKIKQLSLSLVENLEYTEAAIDPKFVKNNIPIVFFVNENYLTYLHVLLLSLLKHASYNFNYDILIFFSGDVERYRKLFLDLCCENVSIRFYNSLNIVQNYINNDELVLHADFYSKDTYYRLLIPKILKNFDKVIYLDVDLIVLDDVAKLYMNFNSEEMAIGAVKSYDVIRAIRLKTITNSVNFDLGNYLDSIGLENKYNYFQAGVLVFNNKVLNKIGFVDSALELLKKTDKFLLQDQDILNILLENRVQFLDPSFNIEWHLNFALYDLPLSCQLSEQNYIDYVSGYNCPKILHYSSAIKPWKNPECKYADIWWKYARESNFYEKFISELALKNTLCCDIDHINSAVYRVKNRLSYKIGELLLKTKTPKQFFLLPFNLLKTYIKFKQYQNYCDFYVKIHSISLNSLESCNDYQEALKIQQHLTYILGNLFVSNPLTFVFKVGRTYKKWKINKGKK
ncbi:DUF4422 domain-containing protein [Campylobacter jejuni]|nr:DUF4422 domain-containing protein [Campylobacter jejuni]